MMKITEEQLETFTRQAHRMGARELSLCSSGNISWRQGDVALVSGTGSWVPNLKTAEVAICEIVTGKPTNEVHPSMESAFHLGIMRARPEVNVVLHFQSEYATSVACMKEIPTNFNVTAEIPYHIGRDIPIIPYYRPGSKELAEAVLKEMKTHNAVLLTNHGQVVCGKDFNEVYERAMFFEMACRIIVQTSGNYRTLSIQNVEDMVQASHC